MNQSKSSIASFEVAINQMTEYLDGLTEPVPPHEVESKLLVFAFAITLAALAQYFAPIGVGNVGPPVHMEPEGRERRRIGVRRLSYRSLFGKLVFLRTYYHDPKHGSLCPLDARLSVPEIGYRLPPSKVRPHPGGPERLRRGCGDAWGPDGPAHAEVDG